MLFSPCYLVPSMSCPPFPLISTLGRSPLFYFQFVSIYFTLLLPSPVLFYLFVTRSLFSLIHTIGPDSVTISLAFISFIFPRDSVVTFGGWVGVLSYFPSFFRSSLGLVSLGHAGSIFHCFVGTGWFLLTETNKKPRQTRQS